MGKRSSQASTVAALAIVLSTTATAWAGDPATAQALFDQGKKLMAQERWAEACPKLEESQRLDPAGGTLLHLALCREHEGRIATAWALYQDAVGQAKRDGRRDRAKIAQERVDALSSRLPRLRLRIAPGSRRAEGFTLKRDDVLVGEAQWGEGLPVDPGAHTLSARATGRKTWTSRIEIPARPEEVVVDIPELELQPDAPPSAARPPALPAAPAVETGASGSGQRTVGLLLGGVGVAGVVVGSIFGLLAFSKESEADKACAAPDYTRCSPAGIDAAEAGTRAGTISTISFIAGATLVGAGVVVYVTAPSGSTFALTPSATTNGAALGLTGRF